MQQTNNNTEKIYKDIEIGFFSNKYEFNDIKNENSIKNFIKICKEEKDKISTLLENTLYEEIEIRLISKDLFFRFYNTNLENIMSSINDNKDISNVKELTNKLFENEKQQESNKIIEKIKKLNDELEYFEKNYDIDKINFHYPKKQYEEWYLKDAEEILREIKYFDIEWIKKEDKKVDYKIYQEYQYNPKNHLEKIKNTPELQKIYQFVDKQEKKGIKKYEKRVNELSNNLDELQDKMLKLSNKAKDFEKKKNVLLSDAKTRIMKDLFKGIDQIEKEYESINSQSFVPAHNHYYADLRDKRDNILQNFIEKNQNHIETLTSFNISYKAQTQSNTR